MMKIVFCPEITGEIKVRRAGAYIQLFLAGQSGDTFVFILDDDLVDHLTEELLNYALAMAEEDDGGERNDIPDAAWAGLKDVPF